MKAEQVVTDGTYKSRAIRFSELPDEVGLVPISLKGLVVTLDYEGQDDVFSAIVLDNVIIPAIVDAINRRYITLYAEGVQ